MNALDQRIRHRFDLLDADRDGVLRSGDFDTLAERVIAAGQADPESPKAAALRRAYRTYWEGLAAHADRDGDGTVDLAEFAAVVPDPPSFAATVRPHAEALVALADPDDDGWVDRDTYVACLAAMGFDPAAARETFADLDPGGTGRVAAADWLASIEGFYTATGRQATDPLAETR